MKLSFRSYSEHLPDLSLRCVAAVVWGFSSSTYQMVSEERDIVFKIQAILFLFQSHLSPHLGRPIAVRLLSFNVRGLSAGLCFTVGFSLIELDLSSWNCVVRVTNNLCTIKKKKVLAESSCHRGLRVGTNRSVRRLHISSPKVRMMDLVLECVDELEVQVLSQYSAF